MLSSKLRDSLILPEQDRDSYPIWLLGVTLVILGTLTFNFLLAVANTNIMPIRETHVVLSELALIGCAVLLAMSRGAGFYVVLAVFLGYMAFTMALRPELDLKAIRDYLIPITFYFLGRKFRSLQDLDRLIYICAFVVLAVGLFEFLFIGVYTRFVDIFDYYVSKGSLEADANFVEGSNLFISATRIGGRNFFPFLGSLRASSVFLEPVTMGNFGAFLCLWGLVRNDLKHRWLMFFLAFLIIVLGDARFGMFVCIAFGGVMVVSPIVPRVIWWGLFFIISFALAIYGGFVEGLPWEDNFTGRILHSSQLMMHLTWESFFGIATNLPFMDDNGYAYSYSQIGVVGLVVLWTLFVFAPSEQPMANRYKALCVTFICLMMVVSNSIYSIKLAALLWLTAGAMDGVPALSRAVKSAPVDAKNAALMLRTKLA